MKLYNSDSGKIPVLVLLDLSAPFDTVDHRILLDRLETVLNWSRSYLEGQSYFVTTGSYESDRVAMTVVQYQGSVL